MVTVLPILHFNDVYRVNPQKVSSGGTIDVTQYACLIDSIRNNWPHNASGSREGLTLFSGDLFAPSVESSITRGSHMVPVINVLAPDVAVTGNHDFDFGYPHLTKLISDCTFPWLLSNIIDEKTSKIPEQLHEYIVLERCGLRIGIIGLVEKEWIATVPSWPSNFTYRDMSITAMDLSRKLRAADGERCDLVLALTHARIPNDISLAKAVNAISPSHQDERFPSKHGVDLILGGHDHLYYASKGVTSWTNYDVTQDILGAEKDEGDVLVAKSGTDFRDLSEIILELSDSPEGSVRRKVISGLKGARHENKPGSSSSQHLKDVLSKILDSVSSSMKKPVCTSDAPLDLRSELIRTDESASGNWFADVIHHAYDDALVNVGYNGADGVLLCAGALRGDSIYGPGSITLGDIMEILPFEDSILVLELDGQTIWDALEASLSTWPAQEGRFPVLSGLKVTWDSRKAPGQRILNVALQVHRKLDEHSAGDSTPNLLMDYEEIARTGDRKYAIVTREYMAEGHDGFDMLKEQRMLIDDEQGQMMSTIVRKYLLGSRYINKMSKPESPTSQRLHGETDRVLQSEKARHARLSQQASDRAQGHWSHAIERIRTIIHSPAHYRDPLNIACREHMSNYDCCDGARVRIASGETDAAFASELLEDDDLPMISPMVDGRLKDVGRVRPS